MLTTNEFIKEAEKLGYQTKIENNILHGKQIQVYDQGNFYMVENESYMFAVNTIGRGIDFRRSTYVESARNRVKVFDLAIEYMNTPDDKRIDEDKWYVYWVDIDQSTYFLDKSAINDPENYDNGNDFENVDDLEERNKNLTDFYKFTREEIAKLPFSWRPKNFGGLGFTSCRFTE